MGLHLQWLPSQLGEGSQFTLPPPFTKAPTCTTLSPPDIQV